MSKATSLAKTVSEGDVSGLLADLRQVIKQARETAAAVVKAELMLMHWRIGQRIRVEVLGSQRADYGEEIVSTVSRQLTTDYGRSFSSKSLRHMMRFSEAFPDEAIVSTLSRQLVADYGHDIEEKNRRRMVQFAKVYSDEEIVVSLSRQLDWIYLLTI